MPARTHSLGLVLTSTLRGPLLLVHCLRRASTSANGRRKTRSPLMANSFLPTTRPAIWRQSHVSDADSDICKELRELHSVRWGFKIQSVWNIIKLCKKTRVVRCDQ